MMFKEIPTLLRKASIRWYFSRRPHPVYGDWPHLLAAMGWLKEAHEQSLDDGVPAYFDLLKKKWALSYPETTGYIIPTFLAFSSLTLDREFRERAIRMGDWEIQIQLPNGGCRAGDVSNKFPRVFNTGQVILGWCSLFEQTKAKRFLSATIRAADWLVKVQDPDGQWSRHEYQGSKTYHARVDWALLRVYLLTKRAVYKRAALRNLRWVISQQVPSGWFKNTSLSDPERPWTHLIAYTIQGLFESSFLLQGTFSRTILSAARKGLNGIVSSLKSQSSFFPGSLGPAWDSQDRYTCLTGDAQLAVSLLRFPSTRRNPKFFRAARRLIEDMKSAQILSNPLSGIEGGIAGSYPVDGAYCSFKILNWATKFFADALMLSIRPQLMLGG